MFDVVKPKKERTSKKLNLGNCKENSGDEIFRILSEMSKQRREIIFIMTFSTSSATEEILN